MDDHFERVQNLLTQVESIFEDTVTQLPHHVMLLPTLEKHLCEDSCLGLVLINVEGLDSIEESHGITAFQEVVKKVSQCLYDLQGSAIRNGDLLALSELGSTSFMIFLTDHRKRGRSTLTRTDVDTIAERVRNALFCHLVESLRPFHSGLPQLTVGKSFVVYNPLLRKRRLINRLIEEAREMARLDRSYVSQKFKDMLEQIIANQQITTVFQPIWSFDNKEPIGVEALSRGPKGTILESPLTMFSLADEVGLAYELDRLCRRQALKMIKQLPPHYKTFINILPKAVQDSGLQQEILTRFIPEFSNRSNLVFEIAEREAIADYSLFHGFMNQILEQGVIFAVDDIGAGYSSFDTIIKIRPGILKLDMTLVKGVCYDPIKKDMVEMFVKFAKRIDASLIAEGIETEEDFSLLKELRVDYGQGFYLARPMPIEELQQISVKKSLK